MREKELNIKNQTYYFLDDMIDIKKFHSNLLKIHKKYYKLCTDHFDQSILISWQWLVYSDYRFYYKYYKDFDIYYINYLTIKKFSNYKNIHSINPLYLIIRSATGYFKEEYDEKYLILDSTEKYEEVFFF